MMIVVNDCYDSDRQRDIGIGTEFKMPINDIGWILDEKSVRIIYLLSCVSFNKSYQE